MSSPFDESHVISSYTSNDAIEDGVLVRPYDKMPNVLITQGVHAAVEEAIKGTTRTYLEAVVPLLMDAQLIVKAGLQKDKDETLWTKGLSGNVTNKTVWIELNDLGGFTLMFPDER